MRDAFVRGLTEVANANPRVMLVTGDLGFGVLDGFAKRFPNQYINAGVAEQNMTGLAAGLALEDRIVYTYSIGNFPILRCLEQIRNDAAYHGANVKIVSIGGGFSYGALGMSHHATEDIAVLRALPEVTVVVPGDLWESEEATKALATTPGVCYIRLDKSAASPTNEPGEIFRIGKARVVRKGARVAVFACGGILGEVLSAADALATEGIALTVVSLHTIKPIDRETILKVAATHDIVLTVEEHGLPGGMGSAVAEVLVDAGDVPTQFRRIGIRGDHYIAMVGSQQFLRRQCGIDSVAIAEEIRRCIAKHG